MTTDEEAHVLRWEAPRGVDGGHPIIAELQSRPGEWAVIWEEGTTGRPWDDEDAAPEACVRAYGRVETYAVQGSRDGRYVRIHARWKPQPRPAPVAYSDAERRLINGGGA